MSDTPTEVVTPEVVKDPGEFGPGSFAPATESLSLKDRLRQSPNSQKVSGEIQGIKRGPGRPRGTGKVKEDEAPKTAEALQKERKSKKSRADDIADTITGEFNDTILRFIIGQGCPPALIYNAGYAPAPVTKNAAKYTEVGAKLAIDDFTASMVGAFIVEFESSDLGSQLVSKATGGPVGLVVKGLVAGACVIGYLNGVRQVVDKLAPVSQAVPAVLQRNAEQNRQNGQT